MRVKTLVVAPSWIGDMVMAQPMLALLQQQGYECDVLALPWIKNLLSRMPAVANTIDMPVGHGRLGLSERYQLGKSLRGQYELAILLPNTLKSALIPLFARIPQRRGFVGESRYILLNDLRKLDKNAMPRLVSRYASLAVATNQMVTDVPYPILEVSEAQQQQTLTTLGIKTPEAPVLCLCPGAEYGPAKRWPAEYYAEVARHHMKQGGEVWLFGSEKDQPVTGKINELLEGRATDFAGRTTLEQAIDLMSLCDSAVTNDSGLMHVAAALGLRVFALFGSTSPAFTPPLSDRALVLRLGLECSPCFERECPLGHLDCLRQLTPDRVIEAL